MKTAFPYRDVTVTVDAPDSGEGLAHITDDSFRSLWIGASALRETLAALLGEDGPSKMRARVSVGMLVSGLEPGMNRVIR